MAMVAACVSACKSGPQPEAAQQSQGPISSTSPANTTNTTSAAHSAGTNAGNNTAGTARPSVAVTPLDYRKDAANHLYSLNSQRIFKGKLSAQLYAIGVLEADIDRKGAVTRLHWLRAPRHAPEVIAEIERTVRAAAPFPVPERMKKVTYTDTWLWDRSGSFQLDTLTEGQL